MTFYLDANGTTLKQHLRELFGDPKSWGGAVFIRSTLAQLTYTLEESDFVNQYAATFFVPSTEVLVVGLDSLHSLCAPIVVSQTFIEP